jgi:TRAP-type C4-dicarboxylate transport system substrate-binding protein
MKAWKILCCLLVLVLSVAVVAVACDKEDTTATTAGGTETTAAGTESTAPAEVFTINWATAMKSNAPTYNDFLVKWAEWITEKSGGQLVFNFQPDETVLAAPELLTGVADGVADMCDFYMGIYAGQFPLNDVITLPLMYDYPASRAAGLTGTELLAKYPELEQEFTDAGVKFLGFMPMGPGQIHTTEKDIRTMADLEGVILECHGGNYATQAVQALGATPESISPAEGFDATSRGIVDGNIGEYEFIVSSGFDVLMNYSTEVGALGMGMEALVMNLDVFNSLPADLQELLTGEGSKAFTEVAGYLMDKNDQAFRTQLDQKYKDAGNPGIYVLPADEKAAWTELILPVWDVWVQDATAKGAAGAEMLADAQAWAAEFAYGYSTDYPESILAEWGVTP